METFCVRQAKISCRLRGARCHRRLGHRFGWASVAMRQSRWWPGEVSLVAIGSPPGDH